MGARVRARQSQAKPRKHGAIRQDQMPEEWLEDAPTAPLQPPKMTLEDEPTQSYQTDSYDEVPYVGWKRGQRYADVSYSAKRAVIQDQTAGHDLQSLLDAIGKKVLKLLWRQGPYLVVFTWFCLSLWQSLLMAKTWQLTRPAIHRIEASGKFESQTVCALAGQEGPGCPIFQFESTVRADGSINVFVLHFVGKDKPGVPCLALRVPPELQIEDSNRVYDFYAPGLKSTPCMSDFWIWMKPDFAKKIATK